jgi:Ca2+-binding EF-hand superfamily protein
VLGLTVACAAGAQTAASSAPSHPQWHDHASMPRIDANGDGVIDRTEAAASSRLNENFDQIDTDHDGKLSRQELRSFRTQQMRQMMVKHMDEIDSKFATADTDHSGTLSQGEATASGIRGLAEHFDTADVDHDGQISRNELNAFMATARHHHRMRNRAAPSTQQ